MTSPLVRQLLEQRFPTILEHERAAPEDVPRLLRELAGAVEAALRTGRASAVVMPTAIADADPDTADPNGVRVRPR